MKWYEKQKKLYQDKMEESISDTAEASASYEVDETCAVSATEDKVMQMVYDQLEEREEQGMDQNAEDAGIKTMDACEETCISRHTSLRGDLTMEGSLHMSGKIIGSISCSHDVHIDGSVEGDIECDNAFIHSAEIIGNIHCRSRIEISAQTVIQGDITSSDMKCDGQILGNITVHGDVTLENNAVVEGNISAANLETEKGASMKGQCTITAA